MTLSFNILSVPDMGNWQCLCVSLSLSKKLRPITESPTETLRWTSTRPWQPSFTLWIWPVLRGWREPERRAIEPKRASQSTVDWWASLSSRICKVTQWCRETRTTDSLEFDRHLVAEFHKRPSCTMQQEKYCKEGGQTHVNIFYLLQAAWF